MNNKRRFGEDQNPLIQVVETSDEFYECFAVILGDCTHLAHARDVADLIHKLTMALLDWQAKVSADALEALK